MSKTLAEKAAWALAMDRGVNMVAVNGGLLLGPDLSITNPYLKGAAEMYENGLFVTVDLDYLVDAHVCVFEDVSSYGRYLCFNHVITQQEDAIKLAQTLAPGTSSPPPRFLFFHLEPVRLTPFTVENTVLITFVCYYYAVTIGRRRLSCRG